MRYLFYYFNCQGSIIFSYSDDFGNRFDESYMGYPLREAIRLFRQKHNLERKHIHIEKLY